MLTFPQSDLSWQSRAYWGSKGTLHGIVAAALSFEPALHHRFEGKATIHADRQITCSVLMNCLDRPTLVTSEPITDWDTLQMSLDAFILHLELNEDDALAFRTAIRNWIGVDYAGVS